MAGHLGGWVGLRWIGDNIMERSMHLKSDGNKDLAGGKDNVERSIEMRFCRICSPNIQSGASSRAKIGGAYFSDVTGSIQDPIAVPGPCEVT